MTWLDFGIFFSYLLVIIGVGAFFSRRAGRSTKDFLVAGRSLPWWLAGTSMIAGSTGADSPLHQTRKIRADGFAGAWFYWSQIPAQIINSIVFSKLWRRTQLLTPVEFYDIRYHGRARAVGRISAVVYGAVIEQPALAALPLVALTKILPTMFDLPPTLEVAGLDLPLSLVIVLAAITVQMVYSATAGVWGVVATDMLEFAVAMVASFSLLYFVMSAVGGPSGLAAGLAARGQAQLTELMPAFGFTMFVYVVLQPLATCAGQTAIAQRYLALKDEREAMLSGVWRVINHYVIRTWPWYLCGLASVLILPELARDSERVYPTLVRQLLPAGFAGLMMTAFFAGAIGQGSHTSAALFVNDLYRPYIKRSADERHYVRVSRMAVLAFSSLTCVIAVSAEGILELLQLIMKMQAGMGLVLVLRWFWWRVNIWADLTVQVIALPVTLFYEHDSAIASRLWGGAGPTDWLLAHLHLVAADRYAVQFILVTASCAAIWLPVMFLTPPEPMERLESFYRRVRPFGFWKPVAVRCPDVKADHSFKSDLWLVSLGLAFCGLAVFGVGRLFLSSWWQALPLLSVAVVVGVVLVRGVARAVRSAEHRRAQESLARPAILETGVTT